MNINDIDKEIEIAIEILNKKSKIQMDIKDEPVFIKRIVAKSKTKDGKDCKIVIYIGLYTDIKDLRIYSRGMKNWAMIRKIPYDDFEDSIKGPGIKER